MRTPGLHALPSLPSLLHLQRAKACGFSVRFPQEFDRFTKSYEFAIEAQKLKRRLDWWMLRPSCRRFGRSLI